MKAKKKILIFELCVTLIFYSVAAYHWLAPRAWAWLDEEQLACVIEVGTIWCLMLAYDYWKHRKDQE